MSDTIHFGTDGWRARIGEGYTFANLRRVAAAAAGYYRDEADGAARGVVIGHDQRFLAREMAEAAAEVLAAAGLPVWLTSGATPTPVISYSVLARGAAGAINLTASHNPPEDLGFKVRDARGGALAPEILKRVEARIPAPGSEIPRLPLAEAIDRGLVRIFDPAPDYRAYVAERVDLRRIAEAGLRVAYDPMWGAGIGWLEWLLGPNARTRFIAIHAERNPSFPDMQRPEPIPPNTDALSRHLRAIGADVGIANDGDADRVGATDEQGQFINQLQVYGLLAYYMLVVRGERGAIVRTLSTTSMLDILGAKYGVDVHETGVGFKYVGPKMLETDAMLGGEESGGFAFRGLPERDGLLVALALLDLMIETGRKPSELIADLYAEVGGTWHYQRIDVRFDAADRAAVMARMDAAAPTTLAGLPVEGIDRTDGYKFWLPDRGWMLIRFSGTEPLLRVYTETLRGDKVEAILQAGLALAGVSASPS
ncbi:MAG: phosphoglucomutase/phosphomannomutase family protein [Caldilineae bacterium]|nr:phosphoglucomutase/phosphomannomutase family protein [Chloroflexota bacterium]MCB9177105.1 phosphoglucomutase/phosphomannomutase family protein [Caldilineae bacterium]